MNLRKSAVSARICVLGSLGSVTFVPSLERARIIVLFMLVGPKRLVFKGNLSENA